MLFEKWKNAFDIGKMFGALLMFGVPQIIGVPQGSVLNSLLINIFLADFFFYIK